MSNLNERLTQTQTRLKSWLFDAALPIWRDVGVDKINGGVFETINLKGIPERSNRRTRVAARQVYSYAQARLMGFPGETDEVIDACLAWLNGPALRDDGLLNAVVSADKEVVRAEFDFYDHAFALLAYATAFKVRPQDKDLESRAIVIREALISGYKHPVRGFEEANPRMLPLKTNPHMHLFEACLAWVEAGGDARWKEIAAEIAELCLDKFLHPENGSLREYFDGDWNPIEGEMGRIIEPGHQFEWAWLLIRWAAISGDDKFIAPAKRLVEIAENYGTDHHRNVTIFELWDDFSVKDAKARLWAQTERMKAYVALQSVAGSAEEREECVSKLIKAAEGLELYFDVPIAGLYRDKLTPDGLFVEEPAPASSLYHIICAIDEMTKASI
ncbi:AGE family epimerase/isomerase [Asticcacaulis excentricus]|uniref:Mannose-6-phosphate isomerase n=1 Tax=Asticcacaulis excentricus (strain ATCC 15261 / DSM 4724 / KCTC 12464 / NCIMB 9791 / VKM B-1370 / CB 48) TaxID=573065 RepID=E8RMR3_ASTEC|nr:AGE family epimerase/isomerase [Asticcacaulis excentricus]ADU13944.1 Mannose-6-phosphate isomerase [Asticcacaulis excentricus CB 48]